MYEVVLVSTLTGTGLTFFSILAASRSQSRASFRFPTTPHLQDMWVAMYQCFPDIWYLWVAWMYQCFPNIWYLWVAWMYQSFMIFHERWIWLEVRILVTSLVHLDVSLLFHCLPSPDIGIKQIKNLIYEAYCCLLLTSRTSHSPLSSLMRQSLPFPPPLTIWTRTSLGWTGSSWNNVQSWAESFILSFHQLPTPWPKLLFHVGDPANISLSTSL